MGDSPEFPPKEGEKKKRCVGPLGGGTFSSVKSRLKVGVRCSESKCPKLYKIFPIPVPLISIYSGTKEDCGGRYSKPHIITREQMQSPTEAGSLTVTLAVHLEPYEVCPAQVWGLGSEKTRFRGLALCGQVGETGKKSGN